MRVVAEPKLVHQCWRCGLCVQPHGLVLGLCGACRRELAAASDSFAYLQGAREPCSDETLLDSRTTAKLLHVTPATVRKMARTGKLRALSIPSSDPRGRRLRFKLADVHKALSPTN